MHETGGSHWLQADRQACYHLRSRCVPLHDATAHDGSPHCCDDCILLHVHLSRAHDVGVIGVLGGPARR